MSWQAPTGAPVGGIPPPSPLLEPRRPLRTVARWLGWALIAGGVVVGAALFVNVFLEGGRQVKGFARGPIPEARLELDGPASYTLFIEGDGLTDEDGNEDCRRCGAARAAAVTVTGPDGEPVDLDAYAGQSTYGLGGHEGVAHSTLRIEEPGTYVVAVQSSVGDEVAIGEYSFGALFKDGLLAAAVFFVGLFAGIALVTRAGRSVS